MSFEPGELIRFAGALPCCATALLSHQGVRSPKSANADYIPKTVWVSGHSPILGTTTALSGKGVPVNVLLKGRHEDR
jgi:hypothetical protein